MSTPANAGSCVQVIAKSLKNYTAEVAESIENQVDTRKWVSRPGDDAQDAAHFKTSEIPRPFNLTSHHPGSRCQRVGMPQGRF